MQGNGRAFKAPPLPSLPAVAGRRYGPHHLPGAGSLKGLSPSSFSLFALLSGVDRCVSCEAPLSGAYCAQCGERRPDRSHLKISAFLHRTFEEVVDFEHSKLIRTLRLLFLRPGYLTTEFVRVRSSHTWAGKTLRHGFRVKHFPLFDLPAGRALRCPFLYCAGPELA